MAEENGWPADWLNDGAKGYVNQKSAGPVLHESAGIRVTSAAMPHLLALKLMAWRDDVDFNDAKHLLAELRRDAGVDVSSPESSGTSSSPSSSRATSRRRGMLSKSFGSWPHDH